MPSKGDWSEVRDACCVPPPTRALIPPVGDEQGRRVIPEKARLMATVGQCHDPPNRSTHCIVVRRAPTAKHGTSTCHPSKHQTRSSHDSLFSPRLAFHERGATPTFRLAVAAVVVPRRRLVALAVHGSRGRQPVHAFVINRASHRCSMWSRDPRSIISCFMLSRLHLDSGMS